MLSHRYSKTAVGQMNPHDGESYRKKREDRGNIPGHRLYDLADLPVQVTSKGVPNAGLAERSGLSVDYLNGYKSAQHVETAAK